MEVAPAACAPCSGPWIVQAVRSLSPVRAFASGLCGKPTAPVVAFLTRRLGNEVEPGRAAEVRATRWLALGLPREREAEYLEIAEKRIAAVAPLFADSSRDGSGNAA